jgi:uncharacterized protein YfbU (UPF0304 family)
MQLSITERYIISNQLRIMEMLAPLTSEGKDAYYTKEDLRYAREVVVRGYELEYADLTEHIYRDPVPEECCAEVLDILNMFDTLEYSYDQLEDKTGLDEKEVLFEGWGGNYETREMFFAQHFCEGRERFTKLGRRAWANCHHPTLERYRAMLKEFNALPEPYGLDLEQIKSVLRAGDC